jgi:hypothetical protein
VAAATSSRPARWTRMAKLWKVRHSKHWTQFVNGIDWTWISQSYVTGVWIC